MVIANAVRIFSIKMMEDIVAITFGTLRHALNTKWRNDSNCVSIWLISEMTKKNLAQSAIEYSVLVIVVALAIIAMNRYVLRGVWAGFKMWENQVKESLVDPVAEFDGCATPPVQVTQCSNWQTLVGDGGWAISTWSRRRCTGVLEHKADAWTGWDGNNHFICSTGWRSSPGGGPVVGGPLEMYCDGYHPNGGLKVRATMHWSPNGYNNLLYVIGLIEVLDTEGNPHWTTANVNTPCAVNNLP